MAAIVQRLERLIVVQDVVGSNPTSRPIFRFRTAREKLNFLRQLQHCGVRDVVQPGPANSIFQLLAAGAHLRQ